MAGMNLLIISISNKWTPTTIHLNQHLDQSLAYMFSGQAAGLLVGGNKYDANSTMDMYVVFDQKYLRNHIPEKSFDKSYLILFSSFS